MSVNGFWSAQNIASCAQQVHQRAAAEQAAQQQAQHQEFMNVAGRTLINIINGYAAQNRPADTDVVAGGFHRAFPQAGPDDYRRTLETLKQEGLIYEMKSVEGFMGGARHSPVRAAVVINGKPAGGSRCGSTTPCAARGATAST